jgi:hypothetical protein
VKFAAFAHDWRWIMPETGEKPEPTRTEELEISGEKLVETVKKLVAEGNVRRLIIKKPDGESLLEIPLTAGVAIGGAMVVFAPVLAAIGALAALIAKVKIVVVREEQPPSGQSSPGSGPPAST